MAYPLISILKTLRLNLRPAELNDFDMRFSLLGDPEECDSFAFDPLVSKEQAARLTVALMARNKSGVGYYWTFDQQNGPRSIGFVDVNVNPLLNGFSICELTYGILQSSRRQGLMKEALTSCIEFLFKNRNFYRIETYVLPTNIASLGLLHSLGFQPEGLQRKKWFFKKQRHDVLLLSLLKTDWSGH